MSGYLLSFFLGAAFTFLVMKISRGSAGGKDAQASNADTMIPASVRGAAKMPAPLAAAITAAVYEYRKANT